jgi:HK97 family phage portal protein
MTAFGRVAAASRVVYPFTPTSHEVVSQLGGGTTRFGVSIGPERAMRISAVYGAVSIISETLAALPLHMYEDLGARGKRPAPEHPLDERLHDTPNQYQTALEFREMMTAFALLRGRGVAEKRRAGPRDYELIPLHPDALAREWTREGDVRWRYRDPMRGGEERVLTADEVFVLGGRFGKSVIEYARDSLGLALTMEGYAGSFYQRGARHSGVLSHPKLLSPKARKNLRGALNEYAAGGDHEGRPMLLEEGMTWTQISLSNKDAEFLESRKFSVAEIARWFRVPPHKLQDLERSTNNNIEHQAIEFVTDTILPWCERWEQVIGRDLITTPRFFAEHNLSALLRGDSKSQAEAWALGIQWGWLSPNEVRSMDNKNPYVGGDLYQRPLNMEPVGSGGSQPGAVAYIDGTDGKVISLSDSTRGHLRLMVKSAAGRAVRKETAAIAKLAERTGAAGPEWIAGVTDFYREHATFVTELLHVPVESAEQYVTSRAAAVLERGPAAIASLEAGQVAELTDLSLQKADVLRLTTAA